MVIKLRDVLYGSCKIEVRPSALHGYGVFAKEEISEGEVIEESYYIGLASHDWEETDEALKDYIYGLNVVADGLPNSALVLGNGMIYNHSEKPNIEYKIHQPSKTFTYTALRNIVSREELLVDYGEGHSASRINAELV